MTFLAEPYRSSALRRLLTRVGIPNNALKIGFIAFDKNQNFLCSVNPNPLDGSNQFTDVQFFF